MLFGRLATHTHRLHCSMLGKRLTQCTQRESSRDERIMFLPFKVLKKWTKGAMDMQLSLENLLIEKVEEIEDYNQIVY
jgi:hypothetical protein